MKSLLEPSQVLINKNLSQVRSGVQKREAGFTLIEIIIVVAIIAILASAVIIAINPAKNLRQARNATRWTQMNAVANGVYSYVIDKKGTFPPCLYVDGATATVRYIYNATETSPLWGLRDLSQCTELVPVYMGKFPAEPQGATYMIGFMTDATTSDRIIIRSTAPEAVNENILIIQ